MNHSLRNSLLLLLLLSVPAAVYLPVARHEFLNYDDTEYVTNNPRVQAGLTWEGVHWAFTTGYAANWHPVTWLSHMLDWQLFGNHPGAHHLVNVGFHLINTFLVFWILRLMTGAWWRSLVVAGLFALHPLHVESVAWVAERKDVLSTMFGLLTIAAYVRYVRRPGLWWYLLALGLYAVGLMCKPMLVTWPFVLLLLDWWPLGRWGWGDGRWLMVDGEGGGGRIQNPESRIQKSGFWSRGALTPQEKTGTGASRLQKGGADPLGAPRTFPFLLLEKLPFFLLAIASSVVTLLAQRNYGAVTNLEQWPVGFRVVNAAAAYVAYLCKMIWPTHLAALYPQRLELPSWPVLMAVMLLPVVTGWVVLRARKEPFLAFGWFWYLGTLVPVIGLVRVGSARMADRYAYIPLIGIFVLLVWGVARWAGGRRGRNAVAGVFAAVVLAACALVTVRQVGVWRNTGVLFEHALAVGEPSAVAHSEVGLAMEKRGDKDAAMAHYREALRLSPRHADSHHNLGALLADLGRFDEAIAHYQDALRARPAFAEAFCNYGNALAKQERYAEAMNCYREALRLKPWVADAHNGLGVVMAMTGRWDEAINQFREAIRLNPGSESARANLLAALAEEGKRP